MSTFAAVILALTIILVVGLILEFLVRCWEQRLRWKAWRDERRMQWWFNR